MTQARILIIDDRDPILGVSSGGRFDGWLMRKHPDGQWVSVRKLTEEDPLASWPFGQAAQSDGTAEGNR